MMDKKRLLVTDARRGSILTDSKFKGYDLCVNPYVGCQFGCSYCYVRFMVKDKDRPWGEFVRVRGHVEDKLPKELPRAAGKRIVVGTMTDPYMPIEREHRLTRKVLELVDGLEGDARPAKVGIFTRSPIVVEDAELIARMPRARVHYSITPFTRDVMLKVEGIAIQTKARWMAIRKLKEAGIRVHVNVAPAIPVVSDGLTEEYVGELVAAGVDEFFVDPMQAYAESFQALTEAMKDDPAWPKVRDTMTDKARFAEWKAEYRAAWKAAWKKAGAPGTTLAIWSDHVNHVWENMTTGEILDPRNYHGDAATA